MRVARDFQSTTGRPDFKVNYVFYEKGRGMCYLEWLNPSEAIEKKTKTKESEANSNQADFLSVLPGYCCNQQ